MTVFKVFGFFWYFGVQIFRLQIPKLKLIAENEHILMCYLLINILSKSKAWGEKRKLNAVITNQYSRRSHDLENKTLEI